MFLVFIFNLIKLFELTSPLRWVDMKYDSQEASWANLLWFGILPLLDSYSGCLVVVWQILIQRYSKTLAFVLKISGWDLESMWSKNNTLEKMVLFHGDLFEERTSSTSHVMGVSTLVTPPYRFWWQPLTWEESYETITHVCPQSFQCGCGVTPITVFGLSDF